MKSFKFKISPTRMLAVSVSLALFSMPIYAGIDQDMKDMFDSAGVSGNYTKAGSFHNQSMNMYTGGSLSVRAPVSKYNNFTLITKNQRLAEKATSLS